MPAVLTRPALPIVATDELRASPERARIEQAEALAEASRLALRWCRRLGGPDIDPEDAAQDVLVVVLRRWRDLRDPADLSRWVWGITRKVVSSHRRRAWLRRWLPLPAEPRTAPPEDDELQVVIALLDSLSEVQREVFVLARVEGRAMPEVAALLGVPEGTARSRLRLARATVRERITTDPRFSSLKAYVEAEDA